jgi:hypothetical protein
MEVMFEQIAGRHIAKDSLTCCVRALKRGQEPYICPDREDVSG